MQQLQYGQKGKWQLYREIPKPKEQTTGEDIQEKKRCKNQKISLDLNEINDEKEKTKKR